MKLALLLLAAVLLPLIPYPEWAAWTCADPATVIVRWTDPPAGIAPFTDGLLFVWAGPDGDTFRLAYQGWYENDQGEIVHEWVATYPRSEDNYYLDFYVKNAHGVIFWATETLEPICKTYLPMVTGGM